MARVGTKELERIGPKLAPGRHGSHSPAGAEQAGIPGGDFHVFCKGQGLGGGETCVAWGSSVNLTSPSVNRGNNLIFVV